MVALLGNSGSTNGAGAEVEVKGGSGYPRVLKAPDLHFSSSIGTITSAKESTVQGNQRPEL